jgi:4-amino-4-deoxy-L-arabinose transferase-like glycosyltransferase
VALLLLGLLGLGLFRILALALNGTDLYVDEAQYWSWSLEPAFGYYSKPPLIAWIIATATHVCGNGEFCVRLPSVIIHTATSWLVFLIGRRLYSEQVGVWSALAFATLPAVSLSSGIISTDVPLLFAWALALLAFAELLTAPTLGMALMLGLAFGLGLNAKYAMAFFVPCAALFFLLVPEQARLLRLPYLWIALALGALLIVPNFLWNKAHDFPTFAHTAANANWNGDRLHPQKAAEFLLAQFGVFGPILFAGLVAISWHVLRSRSSRPAEDRLLFAFSTPIIAGMALQGLLSHANANWAAPAYVAAAVLVTAVWIREASWGWLKASLGLHLALVLLIAGATWQAGKFQIPSAGDPFARTLGNRAIASAVLAAVGERQAAGAPYGSVVTNDRELTAALLYYAPEIASQVYEWRAAAQPHDHYELTRPFTNASPGPVLLVSRQGAPTITKMFGSARPLGARQVPAGQTTTKTVHLFDLSDYRGS